MGQSKSAAVIFGFFVVFSGASLWGDSPENYSLSVRAEYFTPSGSGFEDATGEDGAVGYFLEFTKEFSSDFYAGVAGGAWQESGRDASKIDGALSAVEFSQVQYLFQFLGGYRFVFTDDQVVVPYLGAGVTYGYYRANLDEGEDDVDGPLIGCQGFGGLQIILDRVDPRGTSELDMEYGINHTYIYLGAQWIQTDDSGDDDVKGFDYDGMVYSAGIGVKF